jgi:hypothetical protein
MIMIGTGAFMKKTIGGCASSSGPGRSRSEGSDAGATQRVFVSGGSISRRIVLLAVAVLVTAIGCSTSDPTTSDQYQALQGDLAEASQEIADTEQALADTEAELAEVTAERDGLIAEAAAEAVRYDKSIANAERIAEIIDDPDAIGTKEEVLDEMMAMATPEAIMNDTALGPAPIRRAWSATLWGSEATIKTWVRWMCDDGSQAGSLWTWVGEAQSGEPFELIGINLDKLDDEGRVTASLVDWPYDADYVRESFATGNTTSN